MLTESCVIFFCRPEPCEALFCEVGDDFAKERVKRLGTAKRI